MISAANTPDEYLAQLPEDRKQAVAFLRETVRESLPAGFMEMMQYGMLSYVIPLSLYPAGYHASPGQPLPFLSIASQKNYIALYHMGLYAFPDVLAWLCEEYPRHMTTKLDMGKSCIRFKNANTIPYALIAQLCGKIAPQDYIAAYERSVRQRK